MLVSGIQDEPLGMAARPARTAARDPKGIQNAKNRRQKIPAKNPAEIPSHPKNAGPARAPGNRGKWQHGRFANRYIWKGVMSIMVCEFASGKF